MLSSGESFAKTKTTILKCPALCVFFFYIFTIEKQKCLRNWAMDEQRAAEIIIILGLRKSTVTTKIKTNQSGNTEGITKVKRLLVHFAAVRPPTRRWSPSQWKHCPCSAVPYPNKPSAITPSHFRETNYPTTLNRSELRALLHQLPPAEREKKTKTK